MEPASNDAPPAPSLLRRFLKPDIIRTLIYSKTTIVAQGLNLITVTAIIRTIGNAQFGLYQYAIGLAGTALLFGHFGTDSTSFREFSMPTRHSVGALPRILILRSLGILVSLGILLGLTALGKFPVSLMLLGAVCGTVASESLVRIANGWHRAHHLPWLDFMTTSGRSLLVLVLVFLIVPRLPSARGIAYAYGLGAFIILVSLLVQWWPILRVGWKTRFDWGIILKPAPTFMLIEAAGNMIGLVPVLVFGHWREFEELGRYSIYAKYLGPFNILSGLYLQSLQPTLVQAFHRKEQMGGAIRRGAKIILGGSMLGVVGGLTVGAGMVYWMGGQHPLDLLLLGILALFPIFFGASSFTDSFLIAARKERWMMISHGSGILSSLLIAWFLCPMGAWGGACATVLSFAIKALVGAMLGLVLSKRSSP